jgi:hypothetical protein
MWTSHFVNLSRMASGMMYPPLETVILSSCHGHLDGGKEVAKGLELCASG